MSALLSTSADADIIASRGALEAGIDATDWPGMCAMPPARLGRAKMLENGLTYWDV